MKVDYHGQYDNVKAIYCPICGEEKLATAKYCYECHKAIDNNEKIIVETERVDGKRERTGNIVTISADDFVKIVSIDVKEPFYLMDKKLFNKLFKEQKHGTDKQTKPE